MQAEVKPYVYKVTHKETGQFYIGFRAANKVCAEQDLPKYRTSSKLVRPKFEEFDWQILMEFSKADCAYDYEQYLIHERWGDPLMLNKSCYFGKPRFSMLGKDRSGDKNPFYGRTHSDEAKEKNRVAHIGVQPSEKQIAAARAVNIGNAYALGYKHTGEAKSRISDALKGNQRSKGMKWFTDGERSVTAFKCPEGFRPGRVGVPRGRKHSEESKRKMTEAQKGNKNSLGTHWYTNGVESIKARKCPEGFSPGRASRRKNTTKHNF